MKDDKKISKYIEDNLGKPTRSFEEVTSDIDFSEKAVKSRKTLKRILIPAGLVCGVVIGLLIFSYFYPGPPGGDQPVQAFNSEAVYKFSSASDDFKQYVNSSSKLSVKKSSEGAAFKTEKEGVVYYCYFENTVLGNFVYSDQVFQIDNEAAGNYTGTASYQGTDYVTWISVVDQKGVTLRFILGQVWSQVYFLI